MACYALEARDCSYVSAGIVTRSKAAIWLWCSRIGVLAGLVVVLSAVSRLAEAGTSMSHDRCGRIVKVEYENGTLVNYDYDLRGRLVVRNLVVPPVPIPATLRATKASEGGGAIWLAYDIDSCTASDHAVVAGLLSDFGRVTAGVCSIGRSGSAAVILPDGDLWFQVAGVEGVSYSSVGDSSEGPRILWDVQLYCPGLTTFDQRGACP